MTWRHDPYGSVDTEWDDGKVADALHSINASYDSFMADVDLLLEPQHYAALATPNKFAISRRNKRSKVAKTEAELNLPLHAKPVAPLDVEAISKAQAQARAEGWWDRPTSIEVLQHAYTSTSADNNSFEAFFDAPTADVDAMLAAGVLQPTSWREGDVAVRFFSVVEELKCRRRPIMWPYGQLNASTYLSGFTLAPVSVKRRLALSACAATFDLSASYWQVAVPESKYVLRDVAGRLYRVLRMPYGADFAAECMQLITDFVVASAERDVKNGSVLAPLNVDTHIDNIFAGGEEHVVRLFIDAVVRICAQYSITLNDPAAQTAPQVRVEYCGILFDLEQNTVRPARTPDLSDTSTFQAFERTIGRALYATAVRGEPLFAHYLTLKWWRRQLNKLSRGLASWTDALAPPPAVQRHCERWFAQLASNAPVHVPAPEATKPHVVAAVDASLSGFGIILMQDGCMPRSFGGRWRADVAHINVAEALAAIAVLHVFGDTIANTRLTILIDNTSAAASVTAATQLRTGGSLAWLGNYLVQRAAALGVDVNTKRVASADNSADPVSRGRDATFAAVSRNWSAARDNSRCGRRLVQAPGKV